MLLTEAVEEVPPVPPAPPPVVPPDVCWLVVCEEGMQGRISGSVWHC